MKRLLFLLLPLFLTACGLSDQQKADYASVQRSGVPAATYDKMLHGDPLSLSDVENLAQARVNEGVILRYMRDHGTIYVLNSRDIARLRKAGVSNSIIDYMLQTAQGYGAGPYSYGYPYGPGYYDPFWGPWYGPGFGFYGGGGYYGGHGGYGGHHH